MNLIALMPKAAFNPNFFPSDHDHLNDDELDKLENFAAWKSDILEKVKKLLSLTNCIGIEDDYCNVILNYDPVKRNTLIKAFVLSSKALSEMRHDPRNQKAVEFFKAMTQADYEVTFDAYTGEHPPKAMSVSEIFSKHCAEVKPTLDALFELIDDCKQSHAFSDADLAEILATAVMHEHRSLQQTFTRIMVDCIRHSMHQEWQNPQETDKEVLSIYAVIANMSNQLWFPHI